MASDAGRRYLIVNADDFGMSEGVNRGIVEAHERGIVTSASLMVRWPAAAGAAEYCRGGSRLGLGIHLDFGEWAYRDGAWVQLYEVIRMEDQEEAREEVSRQLDEFRRLVGREPTHLDSHQHVHRSEPLRSVVAEVARGLGVPLRHFTREVRYRGDFYGQQGNGMPIPDNIAAEALIGVLRSVPPGITELACHPGYGRDLHTMYAAEREEEVRVLCDPRLKTAIAAEGLELISFADIEGGVSIV